MRSASVIIALGIAIAACAPAPPARNEGAPNFPAATTDDPAASTPRSRRGSSRPRPSGPDRDGDGIIDSLDRCPSDPEDFDGFQDEDGCLDPDNDADAILDPADSCPNTAGPPPDGCPKAPVSDRDGDGILDSYDKCPDDPETFNHYQDDDGCPDTAPRR